MGGDDSLGQPEEDLLYPPRALCPLSIVPLSRHLLIACEPLPTEIGRKNEGRQAKRYNRANCNAAKETGRRQSRNALASKEKQEGDSPSDGGLPPEIKGLSQPAPSRWSFWEMACHSERFWRESSLKSQYITIEKLAKCEFTNWRAACIKPCRNPSLVKLKVFPRMTTFAAESAPSLNTKSASALVATAPVAPTRTRPPHRRMRIAIAVVVISALAAFSFGWIGSRLSHSETEDAFVESHIVNVAPQAVSGRLCRFLVDENDRVEQGQVLVDDPDYLKQQRAELRRRH